MDDLILGTFTVLFESYSFFYVHRCPFIQSRMNILVQNEGDWMYHSDQKANVTYQSPLNIVRTAVGEIVKYDINPTPALFDLIPSFLHP